MPLGSLGGRKVGREGSVKGGQESGEGRGEMEAVLKWACPVLPAREEAEAWLACAVALLMGVAHISESA